MAAKFSRFTERMDAILAKQGGRSMNRWMDNQEVCRQLNISPRTLQTLRDNGTLAYSQINHKVFYKPEDVMRIVKPGERFLTDREVSARLKVSRRTLQDYRNNGIISYYQLGGKILYKESDIERMLAANYREAFR